MTRTTNARLAGVTFLVYIAAGIASMILFSQATRGAEGTAATLASIARHAPLVRLTAVLTLFTFFAAMVLAVTLYALTRDQDRDLALLALCCRAGEGVVNAVATVRTLGLLSVATASVASATPDAAATALGDQLLKMGGQYYLVGATCFAVGSTIYAYLFLRARSIPVALAGLGVFASILVAICVPLQLAGVALPGWLALGLWLPMLAFEVTLALWLILKGVAAPRGAPSS